MNEINIRRLESRLINTTQIDREKSNKIGGKDFRQVLESVYRNNQNILFSKHALERMDSRNMELTSEELNKLEAAFDKAEDKGVKDALILMGDKAFIASIKNKTIITTLNKDQLKDNVFTNIDGAVII
ncbi:MAG: flagellar protein [Tissierellia bacterium]|nr:flagellar protein [Tissierellia bacterium]